MAKTTKADKAKLIAQSQAAKREQKQVNAAQKTRRQLANPDPNKTLIALPGGLLANMEDWAEPIYHDEQADDFLFKPEKYLKEPNKGPGHYAWPNKKDTKTAAFCRSGRYRKVKKEELRDDNEAFVTTHEGTDEYVYWNDLILVEVSDKFLAERNSQAFVNSAKLAAVEEGYKQGTVTGPGRLVSGAERASTGTEVNVSQYTGGESLAVKRGHAEFSLERETK